MTKGHPQTNQAQIIQNAAPQEAEDTKEPQDIKHDDAQLDSMLTRSVRDREIHAGVLTHPLIMSNLAYHRTTSPIHRGVFLTRRTLGRVLRPPDASFTPLSAELHPELTTRERIQLQPAKLIAKPATNKSTHSALHLSILTQQANSDARKKQNKSMPRGTTLTESGSESISTVHANSLTTWPKAKIAIRRLLKRPLSTS